MIFGRILRDISDNPAGVFYIAVAPAIVGDRIKDIEFQISGRIDAPLYHLCDVLLTTKDREAARF